MKKIALVIFMLLMFGCLTTKDSSIEESDSSDIDVIAHILQEERISDNNFKCWVTVTISYTNKNRSGNTLKDSVVKIGNRVVEYTDPPQWAPKNEAQFNIQELVEISDGDIIYIENSNLNEPIIAEVKLDHKPLKIGIEEELKWPNSLDAITVVSDLSDFRDLYIMGELSPTTDLDSIFYFREEVKEFPVKLRLNINGKRAKYFSYHLRRESKTLFNSDEVDSDSYIKVSSFSNQISNRN